MQVIPLDEKDRRELSISVKKIIGQLQSIGLIIENNKIDDQTFTQLLAVKGGASKICKEIISRGVLTQLDKYSSEELDRALEIIFKL